MRIAILSAHNSIHAVRWVNEMAERGHNVFLLTMHAGHEPLHPCVTLVHLPFRAPIGYFANAVELRRLLVRFQPDILHVHYAGGYGLLGTLSGFHPRIVSVWGSDVYTVANRSPVLRQLVIRTLLTADHVCSTSQVMAHQTLQICPELRNLSVVPFGVDLMRFTPISQSDASRNTVIGTVKTLHPKYGIDTLLQAFATAARELADSTEIRLSIVGDGPQASDLRKLASTLRLDEDVFVGSIRHADVPSHLRTFDIYVALSREDSESFGVAVIEASACGLPVIVSNVGGFPEVVEHGTTGLIVPKDDVSAAAEAIVKLVRDPALRKQMGRAGRARVQQEYNWSDNADCMEHIYMDTVKRCRLD